MLVLLLQHKMPMSDFVLHNVNVLRSNDALSKNYILHHTFKLSCHQQILNNSTTRKIKSFFPLIYGQRPVRFILRTQCTYA